MEMKKRKSAASWLLAAAGAIACAVLALAILYRGTEQIRADSSGGEYLYQQYENGKYGYINKKGEMVIAPSYFTGPSYFKTDELALVMIAEEDEDGVSEWQWINAKGEVIQMPGSGMDDWESWHDGMMIYKTKGKWGIVDNSGTVVLKAVYDSISYSSNKVYEAEKNGKTEYWYAADSGLVKLDCDSVGRLFADEILIINKNKKTGFVNIKKDIVVDPVYDSIDTEYLEQYGIMFVGKNKKYGCIGKTGKILLKIAYSGISGFSEDGLAIVTKNGKCGLINTKGKLVMKPAYDYIEDSSDNGLISVYNNKKCGYISTKGKVVIKPAYNNISLYYEDGLAVVEKNEKYGLVSTKGKVILKPVYDELSLSAEEGLVVVKKNGKYGLYNTKGKTIVKLIYEDAGSVSEGLIAVKKNQKWGYIDTKGNVVIKCKYDRASNFSGGSAWVKRNGKLILIDKKEKEKIKTDGAYYVSGFTEGIATYGIYGAMGPEKSGYIDEKGNTLTAIKYDVTEDFSHGLGEVQLNGKYGCVNKKGKEVIEVKYDTVSILSNGLVEVQLNGKYGLLDKNGKNVTSLKYSYIHDFSEGLALAVVDGKASFIDKTGKTVIKLKNIDTYFGVYPRVGDFSNGLAWFVRDGKYGYINKKGKVVISPQFDKAYDFDEDGVAEVEIGRKDCYIDTKGNILYSISRLSEDWWLLEKSGKCGVVDWYKKEIIKPVYDSIEYSDGYFYVVSDGKTGLLDETGRVLVKPLYDSVDIFSDGIIEVENNGCTGIINREGKEIIPTEYENILWKDDVFQAYKNDIGYNISYTGEILGYFDYDTH
jgi:hypothetical protein